MKKIYDSGNYLIIEDGAKVLEFSAKTTIYTLLNTRYKIIDTNPANYGVFYVNINDIPNWYGESGNNAYDQESFEDLLRGATGVGSGETGGNSGNNLAPTTYILNESFIMLITHSKGREVLYKCYDDNGKEQEVGVEIVDVNTLYVRGNSPLFGTFVIF